MKHILIICYITITLCACNKEQKNSLESKSEAITETRTDLWIDLFDESNINGWRAYNGDALPPGWAIKDHILSFSTEQVLEEDYDYKGSKDLIYGTEEFENFELYVEWKIPPGGNSGIYYHIKEGYAGPPDVAPEYQLIDDENYATIHDISAYNASLGASEPEKLQDWQSTAADYAMYTPDPSQKQLNPAGQWNNSKIVFTTEKVEYWLNGKMVLFFVPWSDDWYERRNSGKWNNAPDYGKFRSGYIGFQDHGSSLWFRNVKIKKL